MTIIIIIIIIIIIVMFFPFSQFVLFSTPRSNQFPWELLGRALCNGREHFSWNMGGAQKADLLELPVLNIDVSRDFSTFK